MAFSVPTPPDFSFAETLRAHGWRRLAPFRCDEAAPILERTEELSDGRIALVRIAEGTGGLEIETDAEDAAEEITRRVRRMLQLDLSLAGFHAYCRARPGLEGIAERRQGRMLRCPTLFEDVVKVIATVNTTWAQTVAMTARIVAHFGPPHPGQPDHRAFPTPDRLAAVPLEEFAAHARMGYRNAYVHTLAAQIASGALDLEAWQTEPLTADELRRRLLALPGIGPYGAACLMLYLGKPEHVNADSWARMLVGKELGRPVTDREVREFFQHHGPWRGLVYMFYPWREG